ncbi:uncharacterized protein PEZ65_010351 isoform 2-T2 [Lycodopsis pacificus]
MPPQPTMSPCPSTLQLSPSVCLRLLCLLLLLTDRSSSVPIRVPVLAELLTQHNTTQANCSPECKLEDHSLPDSSSSKDTVNHPPNQQLVSLDQQGPSPAMVSQTAVPLTFTSTGFSMQVTDTGPITSTTTSTTMEHVTTVHTTTSPVTSKATTSTTTTTRTSTAEPTTKAAEQPATTADATTALTKANPSVALPTTTGTKTSPPPPPSAAPPQPPSTGMPSDQTSLPRAPTTVTSTSATADRDKPVSSGSRVAVVDVAGDALTSQLVDTASLLAVLLFGLLFFLVTVAVFVTQAYESYRRKDYTQVDYLINGMYSDSGV